MLAVAEDPKPPGAGLGGKESGSSGSLTFLTCSLGMAGGEDEADRGKGLAWRLAHGEEGLLSVWPPRHWPHPGDAVCRRRPRMASIGWRKAARPCSAPQGCLLLPVAVVLLGVGVAELSSQLKMSWHLM